MNLRGILILLVIGILAVVGWSIQESIQTQGDRQAQPVPTEPDYYMHNFRMLKFGIDGKPVNQVEASRMRHYPGDQHSELDKPKVRFYRPQGSPWLLISDTGNISGDQKTVKLNGKVFIERKASPVNKAVTVVSRNLVVYPDRSFAHGEEAITISGPGHRLQGIGVNAWFQQDKLEILSNVRSQHEP
jgi:lipopolysaccharide export system protein LptC